MISTGSMARREPAEVPSWDALEVVEMEAERCAAGENSSEDALIVEFTVETLR